MDEMTAEKAVEWLTSDKAFGQECYGRKQIAALIEQQAAEIERLKDLHRSILWFVEEHKKIPNCKKWMPLIEAKSRQGIEKEAQGAE